MDWIIQRDGRAWRGVEAFNRHDLFPGKVEMIDGMLCWSEAERMTMLALLLENIGTDKAVQLGDPKTWRQSIASLPNK